MQQKDLVDCSLRLERKKGERMSQLHREKLSGKKCQESLNPHNSSGVFKKNRDNRTKSTGGTGTEEKRPVNQMNGQLSRLEGQGGLQNEISIKEENVEVRARFMPVWKCCYIFCSFCWRESMTGVGSLSRHI